MLKILIDPTIADEKELDLILKVIAKKNTSLEIILFFSPLQAAFFKKKTTFKVTCYDQTQWSFQERSEDLLWILQQFNDTHKKKHSWIKFKIGGKLFDINLLRLISAGYFYDRSFLNVAKTFEINCNLLSGASTYQIFWKEFEFLSICKLYLKKYPDTPVTFISVAKPKPILKRSKIFFKNCLKSLLIITRVFLAHTRRKKILIIRSGNLTDAVIKNLKDEHSNIEVISETDKKSLHQLHFP